MPLGSKLLTVVTGDPIKRELKRHQAMVDEVNALEWRGAHLVTVNDYLARRDAGWNGPLYHTLGMSVGVIVPGADGNPDTGSFLYDPEFLDETHPDSRLQHLRPCTRREAYAADI